MGWEVTVQVHMVHLGPQFSGPPHSYSKGMCGFLLQEEVSADGQLSVLSLYQEIIQELVQRGFCPRCASH